MEAVWIQHADSSSPDLERCICATAARVHSPPTSLKPSVKLIESQKRRFIIGFISSKTCDGNCSAWPRKHGERRRVGVVPTTPCDSAFSVFFPESFLKIRFSWNRNKHQRRVPSAQNEPLEWNRTTGLSSTRSENPAPPQLSSCWANQINFKRSFINSFQLSEREPTLQMCSGVVSMATLHRGLCNPADPCGQNQETFGKI